jgi:hypothetical protein
VIADADDSSSLAAMAAGTDVIISTAGKLPVTFPTATVTFRVVLLSHACP